MDNPHPIIMTVNGPPLQADLYFPTITLSDLRDFCETSMTDTKIICDWKKIDKMNTNMIKWYRPPDLCLEVE